MVKQYIILRKDPITVTGDPITAAKLAVATAHASSAFLMNNLMATVQLGFDKTDIYLDKELKDWLSNNYTKVLLGARLKDMQKLISQCTEEGLKEYHDFFVIRDACNTEVLPDKGEDKCLIAIGFRPMEEYKIKPFVKRLQLYK
jgi:peptidyl-tRNA hydrolase